MSFTTLPAELHLQIVEFLEPEPFDILCLSNASRQLRLLLRPRFYKCIKDVIKNWRTPWHLRFACAPEQNLLELWDVMDGWDVEVAARMSVRLLEMLKREQVKQEKAEKAAAREAAMVKKREKEEKEEAEDSDDGAETKWFTAEDENSESESESESDSENDDEQECDCRYGEEHDVGCEFSVKESLSPEKLERKQKRWGRFITLLNDFGKSIEEERRSDGAEGRDLIEREILNHCLGEDNALGLATFIEHGFRKTLLDDAFEDEEEFITQPMFSAVSAHAFRVIKVLIENGANPNALIDDRSERMTRRMYDTPGYSIIFTMLLWLGNDALDGTEGDISRQLELIEVLVKAGGDINCIGTPYSPIYDWFHGDEVTEKITTAAKVFPRLLKMGLNPNPEPPSEDWQRRNTVPNYNPVFLGLADATRSSFVDADTIWKLLRAFLKAGTDTETPGAEPFRRTILVELVRRMVGGPDFDHTARRDLLHFAKILIEFGAKTDATDEHGYSPLVIAAAWGQREILEVLLPDQPEMVEKWLGDKTFWAGLDLDKTRQEIGAMYGRVDENSRIGTCSCCAGLITYHNYHWE
ncbi:hypothetical protein BJ508DRAFT_411286 [Ascobolus immersus RN42]|uniref:Uncharacterized protein n=1 Tax=Ascobolus immersus RN42 TaxID=1160509 RepID=A0A3N4IQZ2_ASCIM|nr:hypothetical protein BJ508DRAFT_411286 [Ascobolus immersus RN42]